jgi:hypothetical protein
LQDVPLEQHEAVVGEAAPQGVGQAAIDLDRRDTPGRPDQTAGQRPTSGADLQYGLAGPGPEGRDDTPRGVPVDEEVLAERARSDHRTAT